MVNLIHCSIADFNKNLITKPLVCFGAGEELERFFSRNNHYNFENKIKFIVDNNENLSGQMKSVNNTHIPIISFRQLLESGPDCFVLLVTNLSYIDEILDQLDHETALDGIECYISALLDDYYSTEEFEFTKGDIPKIPKKIHYCWFGHKPLPARLQKFIESWKQFCPDYEIFRWDENNYDITKNLYMKQAYDIKKWGFVPDYARLDIIYNHGGIYLDTDVEIIHPLGDLLYDDMFCGFESNSRINFGLGFGAIKKHLLIKNAMDRYDALCFINPDNSLNLSPSPVYQTADLIQWGFKPINSYQKIRGAAVYPREVLCPVNFLKSYNHITNKSRSIHHFDASWIENDKRINLEKIRINLKRIIKERCFNG